MLGLWGGCRSCRCAVGGGRGDGDRGGGGGYSENLAH